MALNFLLKFKHRFEHQSGANIIDWRKAHFKQTYEYFEVEKSLEWKNHWDETIFYRFKQLYLGENLWSKQGFSSAQTSVYLSFWEESYII